MSWLAFFCVLLHQFWLALGCVNRSVAPFWNFYTRLTAVSNIGFQASDGLSLWRLAASEWKALFLSVTFSSSCLANSKRWYIRRGLCNHLRLPDVYGHHHLLNCSIETQVVYTMTWSHFTKIYNWIGNWIGLLLQLLFFFRILG